ncbi:MAG: rod shape-determining protein [Brachymonas sp.]|nr:rod shape-determining protein [Brachymonas sp.]
MFSALKTLVYIQIAPDWLVVKNVKTGVSVADVPELAISLLPHPKILAVGAEARKVAAEQAAQVVNPFAHPRSLASDFVVAEQLIKHQLRKVLSPSWLSVAPHIVIHPLGSPEGGFTQVELRAFHEMARAAGASSVFIHTGAILADHELLSLKLPNG